MKTEEQKDARHGDAQHSIEEQKEISAKTTQKKRRKKKQRKNVSLNKVIVEVEEEEEESLPPEFMEVEDAEMTIKLPQQQEEKSAIESPLVLGGNHAQRVYERHRDRKIFEKDDSKGAGPAELNHEVRPSILSPEGRKALRKQLEDKIAMVTGRDVYNIQCPQQNRLF